MLTAPKLSWFILMAATLLATLPRTSAQDPAETNIAEPHVGCDPNLDRARKINDLDDWTCMSPAGVVSFFVPGADFACLQVTCLPWVFFAKVIGNRPEHLGFLTDARHPDLSCEFVTNEIMTIWRNNDYLYMGHVLVQQEDGQDILAVRINNSYSSGRDDLATFTPRDVRHVIDQLKLTINEAAVGMDLHYYPKESFEQDRVDSWFADPAYDPADPEDPLNSFEIYRPAQEPLADVESYSPAVNYGTVRRYTDLHDFEDDTEDGSIGSKDIAVLPEVPFDVDTVLAGVVTAKPAAVGNHVIIRSINRATPFVFVNDALSVFSQYDGQLVRLSVFGDDTYDVEPADPEAAAAFWDLTQPDLSPSLGADMLNADLTDSQLDDIKDPTVTPDAKKHGGKGANLIKLVHMLRDAGHGDVVDAHIVNGFVIPFAHYELALDLVHVRSWITGASVTQKTYIQEISGLDAFTDDSSVRNQMLQRLRVSYDDRARHLYKNNRSMVCRMELIRARIGSVFGSTLNMVRFRSSSNAEDNIEFNGAGLYESTTVCGHDINRGIDCLGDTRPGISSSRCDSSRGPETIEEGLEKVWLGLHLNRAVAERVYYKLPNVAAKMAVLVTPMFADEEANGVAFTGNPGDKNDKRYVVYVQPGGADVVRAEDGHLPETDILAIRTDGAGEIVYDNNGDIVFDITRAGWSTLKDPNDCTYVLSTDQLNQMGNVLYKIDESFTYTPDELAGHDPDSVIEDIEFKWEPDDDDPDQLPQLKIKQIRPLLIRPKKQLFIRGDCTNDGTMNTADMMLICSWKSLGGPPPECFDAADANDDGVVDLSDVSYIANYQYLGTGPQPPFPFPWPGVDPTIDHLPECIEE